jgi:hypothetical protein
MMSIFSKIFLSAVLTMASASAMSQALNTRWHGYWKSTEDTLSINDQMIKIVKESCRWANAKPEKMTGCVAFYDGTISKAQLMTQFEAADKASKDLPGLKQAQKDRIRASMDKNREVLTAISNDTFKMVRTITESKDKGSADCTSFYFLDRESVFFVLNCAPAPEAYTVRPYKKGA